MSHGRVVPWKDEKELDELKQWFYSVSDGNDLRLKAISRVKSYKLKGSQYLPHVIDSTAQLTSAILADEKHGGSDDLFDKMNIRMTYTMAMIRFVNGVLDPSQQTQFAIPLHTIARNVGLPSWFVDLRHWGTHERDLPNIDMLRMAAKDALQWLWKNYWDNDELDDSLNEDDALDEETIRQQEYLDRLRLKIELWKNNNTELRDNCNIWLEEKNSIISSDNFVVDDGRKTNSSKADQLVKFIDETITEVKYLWKVIRDKNLFMRTFLKFYDDLFLSLLVRKLPGFDLELIKWMFSAYTVLYQDGNLELKQDLYAIRSRFSKWIVLEKELLSPLVSLLNIRSRISELSELFNPDMTFMQFKLLSLLVKKLEEDIGNHNWRRKKRRKDNNDTTAKLNDTQRQWNQLVADYLKSHVMLEEEKQFSMYGAKAKAVVKKAKEASVHNNELSDDLQKLKQRLLNLKSKESVKPPSIETFNWDSHDDWQPKPFGIL
ncbi:related to Protein LAS1 [Nakaseomyces glabratus]|nr:rRNA-processing protein las1 [Nakaseomyces glabratus]QNG16964.1 uncharacterized protein GWK60_M05841 [Nakaseomyces glabratus]SCV14462.1 related to Protein LAS1 [Nakaseomyces glabratus]SLM13154.1 related to Protein LAS1 [Nakaseomyces glabratus]